MCHRSGRKQLFPEPVPATLSLYKGEEITFLCFPGPFLALPGACGALGVGSPNAMFPSALPSPLTSHLPLRMLRRRQSFARVCEQAVRGRCSQLRTRGGGARLSIACHRGVTPAFDPGQEGSICSRESSRGYKAGCPHPPWSVGAAFPPLRGRAPSNLTAGRSLAEKSSTKCFRLEWRSL